ncbi:transposase [Streptomyces sp. NPDC059917]|uniref:transposase n=1 Tax=Streptomyces sp. NPDC059917 TaxID=3347002 RepID=UPI00365EA96C
MAGVIMASEPSWIVPFTGLSPQLFRKLITVLRHEGADEVRRGRPWSLSLVVVIDADSRQVVLVGRPMPGNRNDCKAWSESGAKAAVGGTTTIADGGYPGTGLIIPHRRPAGGDLCDWKRQHNRPHKQVRARVEHVFARMKTWTILRDCRLKGDGVHHAMLGIARLHNLRRAE